MLNGEEFSGVRNVLFAELGHSRAVKTRDWKYVAVRYPPEVQRRLENGDTFRGFEGEILERPYLTRNSHLGHFAAKANPNYFDADQLYNLEVDPEETQNVFRQNPEIADELRRELSELLSQFPDRPFEEFTD